MKKYEKEALKKAFNIPDPQHKEEFINQLDIKKNNPKRHFPIITRYASMAAFAAVMISIITNLSLTADFPDQFTSDKTIIPTISVSATTEEPQTTTSIVQDQIFMQTTVSPTKSETTAATASYETNTRTTAAETIDHPITSLETTPPNTTGNHETSAAVQTESTNPAQPTTPTKTTSKTEPTQTSPATTKKPETLQTTVKTEEPVPVTTTAEQNNVNPSQTVTTTKNSPPVILTTSVTKVPSHDNEPGADLTVYPTSVYTPTDMIINKYEFDIDHNLSFDDSPGCKDPMDTPDAITIEHFFDNSAFIFRGTIKEKIYTDVSGQPYTQENIVITDVCKSVGSYKVNDFISVYLPGGYMPVTVYAESNNCSCDYPDDYTIYSNGGNKSVQDIGDEFYFFLNYGTDEIPYGAFQLTALTDISIFRSDGDELISLGNDSFRIPLSMVQ